MPTALELLGLLFVSVVLTLPVVWLRELWVQWRSTAHHRREDRRARRRAR